MDTRCNTLLAFAAALTLCIPFQARADNGAYANSGGTFTTGSAVGQNISVQNASLVGSQATLSLACPITSYGAGTYALNWTCAGGTLSLAAPDSSLIFQGTFSSGSMSFTGSGGGRYGHTTYYYDFFGTFSGTITVNGVTEAVNGSVSELVKTSRQIGTGSAPVTSGSFGWNSAYSPVYVGDRANARLLRADNIAGANLVTYGGPGSGVGNFGTIAGLAQDVAGRLYLTDSSLNRFVRIDNFSGKNWMSLGSLGAGVNQFNSPLGVAVDAAGKIWVADSGNNRIVRFDDPTGKNWTTFGTLGSGVSQLSAPSAIAFDAQGRIYIADAGNNRIARVDDLSGTNWTTLSTVNVGIYGYSLQSPTAIALSPSGEIYVSLTNGFLVATPDMSGTSGIVTQWSSPLAGISLDAAGTIYVIGSFTPGLAQIVDANASGYFASPLGLPGLQASAVLAGHSSIPTPAAPTISDKSLVFESQNVGEPGLTKSVTLTNQGSAPLAIASITAGADYQVTDGCASPLLGGQSCTVAVQFDPVATGARNSALSVQASSGVHPILRTLLYGTGTVPQVALLPGALSYNPQQTGTASGPQLVTLMNPGSGPLTISSITSTGDFAQTSNCPAVVAAGSGCTIQLVFKPSSAGARSGSLVVSDDATPGGAQQSVPLSGTGSATAAGFTLTPESLIFPAQQLQTTSHTQTMTLVNHSGAKVSLAAATYSTGFKGSTTCGATLASGTSCAFKVAFAPKASGPVSGAFTLPITGRPSLTAALSGTGVPPGAAAALLINPSSLDFGVQVVGDNPSLSLTITNPSGVPAGIQSIAFAGPKQLSSSHNCPTVLAGGATCKVSVTFLPSSSATYYNGTLTISESAGGTTQVPVSGIATTSDGGGGV